MVGSPLLAVPEGIIDADTPLGFAAVLFDMDGSLVDTEPIWHAAEFDLMAGYGATWTEADQAHALGGPMLRVGRYITERLADHGVAAMTPEQAMQELLAHFERHLDAGEIAAHDGAEALLMEAMDAGLPLALVSNSTRRLMDKVLAAHPEYRFDVTIAGDEVALAKPHPGPYLEAAERLGVPIADCLIVEDSPTGVAAARDSGAAVVAVQHMGQLDPGPRGMVVAHLDGLSLAQLAGRLR
jgi:HAD superfamily hydrolase (TIGR01509 family)